MMTMVRLHEVSKEWNGNELFAGLNLEINEGERLAILGRNGCGKTTLLRIILGEEDGGGRIERHIPQQEWGFMRQRSLIKPETNVLDAVRQESGLIYEVKRDLEDLEQHQVATGVIEFSPGALTKYKGGYTDYKRHKERELREQEATYRKQELERKALEETIRNYQQWFHQAHNSASDVEVKITQSFYKAKANKNISRYHAKQKQLERLEKERVDKPREAAKLNMELQVNTLAARQLLALEDASFGYPGSPTLLRNLRIAVERGDRLAVRGPNGTGKTTLLKLMIGELEPSQGKVTRHPQLKIGYFSQELEGLPESQTLLDSLLSLPSMTQSAARTILGCFLFSRDDVFKRIGDLSMGEKCRVAFLRLYFGGANLLVLDEPTNYLDIDTQEVMENILKQASGALVLVSHDRMLTKVLANRLLDLEPGGKVTLFDGGVEDWEQSIKLRESALEIRDGRLKLPKFAKFNIV
ncbi:hypothetical protein G195_001945 [Phytophthora kernoviae 00238/432]|uniref:ABC transporter domain-containing protein n=1 Tax=Phytophthora kernoviae 00238/432 TaxID=1284355 RepID=A0A8J4SSK6_9STRA|nr:hypothetical protein G195_001945 [Phytophthora kernoviae 00238/432]